ncbi:MAG: cation transporter dimerization domain-containing protein [Allosphingosinicella sp.]
MLIGEAAHPELIADIRLAVSREGVMGVGEIMTLHNSPDQIVAAVNVDFDNRLGAGDVERIASEIERSLRAKFPAICRVYVRPHEDSGVKFGAARGLAQAPEE